MEFKKRTGNETLRPKFGKTSKYNRWPRFVDLNDYADRLISYTDRDADNIEELRSVKGSYDGEAVNLLGYYEKGDQGAGLFFWDSGSEDPDDSGTVIKFNGSEEGRWKRVLKGQVTPEMFGAVGDGVEDDTEPIRSAISSGTPNIIGNPTSVYKVTDTIDLKSNLRFRGLRFFQPSDASNRIMFEGEGTTVNQVMPFDIAENSFEITVDDGS